MLIRILLIVLVVAVAALFVLGSGDPASRGGLVALVALAISLVSAFKGTIFPFRPKFLIDEVVLAAADSPRQDSPALIVPLLIVNEGAGSGLVSGLALKVEGNGVVRMYTPIAEIDFGRFLSDRRKLHADNTISTFGPVPLQGESTARRHFVFIQEPSSERYPFAGWTPGKFTFRLFAKFSLSTNPREVAAVSHEITSALLASYVQGQSTSMSSSKEIDV